MPVDQTDAAEALVRAYCGWHVAPSQTDTVYVDGTGTRNLMLPSLHVTDVSVVTDDGVTLVDTYEWSADGRLFYSSGYFTGKFRGVEVTFTHGYDEMPDDVQNVIEQIAARGASTGAYVQVGQVRVATDSSGAPLSSSLTDADKAALAPYKLPPRP